LLRPPELKQAREDLRAGRITPLGLKRIEDEAVDQALALQERAGLDIVSDGEMRRAHFTGPLSEVVAGMEAVRAPVQQWHGTGEGDEPMYAHVRAVTGKLRRLRSLASEEFVYMRARTQKPIKATLPSPLMMQTFWSPEHSPASYADPFELFADAAAILREEARELVALGCEFIQVDAPDIGFLVDESVRASLHERGIDPNLMLGEGIEIINSVADVPGARVGIHLCKGNREGNWLAAGGYEAISAEVFPRLVHFDLLLLEYDDERSGGFEPLADVPREKLVVLGLIFDQTARDAC
jgi:5-methyltetrahydropteroyltriglutamate--homocysteine methyltransferase